MSGDVTSLDKYHNFAGTTQRLQESTSLAIAEYQF